MDKNTTSASEMQKNALENIEKAKEILTVVPTTLDNLKEAKKFLDDAIEIIEGSRETVEDDDTGYDEEIMSLANAMMSRKVEQPAETVEDDDTGYDEEIMSHANAMMSRKVEQPTEPPKLVAEIDYKKKEQGSKLSDAKTEQQPTEPPKLVAKIVDKKKEQGSKLSDAKTEQQPAESPKLVAKIVGKVKTSPKTGATLFDDPPLSDDKSNS